MLPREHKMLWSVGLFILAIGLGGGIWGSYSQTAGMLQSRGGIPSGGFPTSTSGCTIDIAGGTTNTSTGGAPFVQSCDSVALGYPFGNYFRVVDNNVAGGGAEFEVLAIKTDNAMYINALHVQPQGLSTGQPNPRYYGKNFVKSTGVTYAQSMFTLTTDVPSSVSPIASVWGIVKATFVGAASPPLWQQYGSTFYNASLYDAATGLSPIDGTLVDSLEDNGNHFSNQLVRTTQAINYASTTTLANVSNLAVPVITGRTFAFTGKLYVNVGAGGVKLAINSTATVSNIVYIVKCFSNAPAINVLGQQTALGGATGITAAFVGSCEIDGSMTTTSGGAINLTGTTTSGSPTMNMSNTTGLIVGQQVTQIGVGNGDTISPATFISAIVPNTSITLSKNALRTNGSAIMFNFWDTVFIQAAQNTSNVANSTIMQGSTFSLNGSINGGSY